MQVNSKFLQKYGILLVSSLVFWAFFMVTLIQGWNAFSLLLFPLAHYLLYFWLQLMFILRNPYTIASYQVEFITMGDQHNNSKPFLYSALADLLLIVLMGVESKYHPQLVNDHFVLYLIPIGLLFIFSPFLGLNKLFLETRITLMNGKKTTLTINFESKQRKNIMQTSIIIVSALAFLWIGFSLLGYFEIFSFPISVPRSEEYLSISYILIPIFVCSLAYPIFLLVYSHITILKKCLVKLHENNIPGKSAFLSIIQHYILFPRLYIA